MQPTFLVTRLFNQVARIILFCICAGKLAILVTILNAKQKAASIRTTTIAYSTVGLFLGGGEGREGCFEYFSSAAVNRPLQLVCFVYFRSCDNTLGNCFF